MAGNKPLPTAPRLDSLAAYLAATGTSQRAFARTVGVTQSTVSMLVSRRRAAGGALAQQIHEITGVPLENLLASPHRPRRRRRKRGPPGAATVEAATR